MAWTANLTNKTFSDGVLSVMVEYTDGALIVRETYRSIGDPGPTWIADSVAAKLKMLTKLSNYVVTPGPVTPTPDPAPEDPAFVAWRKAVDRLRRATELIDQGVLLTTDARVVNLRQIVRDGLPAYGELG